MTIIKSGEFDDTNSDLFDQKKITVGTTEVEAVTDDTVSLGRDCRQFVRIYNLGTRTVYVGPTGVTDETGANTGEPLRRRQWIEYAVRDQEIYMITSTGTADVIVTDFG